MQVTLLGGFLLCGSNVIVNGFAGISSHRGRSPNAPTGLTISPKQRLGPLFFHHQPQLQQPERRTTSPTPFLQTTVTATTTSLCAEKLSSEEVQNRFQQQLAKLREKDRQSRKLSVEELKVVFEDDHILVVDKPAGVLCVPSEAGVPSMAQVVFERYVSVPGADTTTELTHMNQMVVHRLGMDTSGLLVFCKTAASVRGMNSLFRTRKIKRQYEALCTGHITKDQGLINLPIMRDYEHPPFMRVSTDEHQKALLDFDADIVGKKLLEAPKASLTHYQVLTREYLKGNTELPVTRLTLTSLSGRTHQLNVHCAAIGHPIVRDMVYGYQGDAAPFGGLEAELFDAQKRQEILDLQKKIHDATEGMNLCVHAKLIQFRHPITKETVEFQSPPPF